jgi:prevent-host-death family protein
VSRRGAALAPVSRVIQSGGMTEVSVRDLRNRGGHVIDRVARGERVTITRDGKPVAELRPYIQANVSAEALLTRWSHLPVIDPVRWRNDLDELIDSRT